MKKLLIGWCIITALILLAARAARAQDEVVVAPSDNGVGAIIGVDLLGAGKWQRLAAAPWYRKADVAVMEYVAKPIARNPGKTALAAIGTIGGIRAAEGKLDDDLKDIWESVGLRDDDRSEPKPEPAELVDGITAVTRGNNSPVYVEVDEGENVAVETEGDNSPIVIVRPEPPPMPEVDE
jgi:hypothetical protein